MSSKAQESTEIKGKIIVEFLDSEEEDQENSTVEKESDESEKPAKKERYVGCDCESDEEHPENGQEKEEEADPEDDPAVFYRIKFRNHTTFPCDQLYVEATTPAETAKKTLRSLGKGDKGQTFSRYFQFRHTLKESNYKNSYILQLDAHKLTFDENHELGPEFTSPPEPANTVFRGRNMATEELRKVLKLDLHVWKSFFESNRPEQMGELDLSESVDSVTAEHLTIEMDSRKNIIEIVKIHKVPLDKFTLISREHFEDLVDLEQVRTAGCLKLCGESKITDKQLMSIEAFHFEIQSGCVTENGLKEFVKERLIRDVPNQFFAMIQAQYQNWKPADVLKGLPFTKYKDQKAYQEKNGCVPIHGHNATLAHLPIENSKDRLVVVINEHYFECFKEGKRTGYTSHEYFYLD